NLDPQRGVPVSLVPEDLERKLVAERRGGYCFEQNLLLKAALEALGAEVDLFLARARRLRAGRRWSPRPSRRAVAPLGLVISSARSVAGCGRRSARALDPTRSPRRSAATWRGRRVCPSPPPRAPRTRSAGCHLPREECRRARRLPPARGASL